MWLSGLLPGNELSHVSGAVQNADGLPILLLFHFSHDVSFNHIELMFLYSVSQNAISFKVSR